MRLIIRVSCLLLLTAGCMLAKESVARNGSIPLLPDDVFIGMKLSYFKTQRKDAKKVGMTFSENNESLKERGKTAVYLEGEFGKNSRSATSYLFLNETCVLISHERYYLDGDYTNNKRQNILNKFYSACGTECEEKILYLSEPSNKTRKLKEMGIPTLLWEKDDNYVLLVLFPLDFVKESGMWKVQLKVVNEQSLGRLKLSSSTKPFPIDIKQAINKAKKHVSASKR